MMIANYEKVIILREGEEKKVVVIADEKTHTPTFYNIVKCGMDDIISIHGDNSKIINSGGDKLIEEE